MSPLRNLVALIAVLAAPVTLPAAAQALPADFQGALAGTARAASAKHATAPRAIQTTILRKHVKVSGVYAVRVAVTARRSVVVDVVIGRVSRRAVTSREQHRAIITQLVTVRGNVLTIRASSARGKPTVTARARRVGSSVTGGSDRSDGSTAGATGAASASPGTTAAASTPVWPGTTMSAGTSGATSGPPGDPSSWHPIFDDEFDSLNASDWSTSREDSGTISPGFNSTEEECFDPAQATVGGGEADLNLVAEPETCSGATQPYAGSILDTSGKWYFTYGYMEARIWLPTSDGQIADWPAFWAVGNDWPVDGELDVMEGLGGAACWHFHYGSPSDPQQQGGCASGDYPGGWHTFGADWEPGSVTWYYDGQDVGNITTGVTSSPMAIILDLAIEPGDPVQVPATMRVAYVRAWQH